MNLHFINILSQKKLFICLPAFWNFHYYALQYMNLFVMYDFANQKSDIFQNMQLSNIRSYWYIYYAAKDIISYR